MPTCPSPLPPAMIIPFPPRVVPRFTAREIGGRWYVLDTRDGRTYRCADEGVARELAALLDGVRRLVGR